jgi:hypothetical protein
VTKKKKKRSLLLALSFCVLSTSWCPFVNPPDDPPAEDAGMGDGGEPMGDAG